MYIGGGQGVSGDCLRGKESGGELGDTKISIEVVEGAFWRGH